jgi:hypothetical protein
VHQLHREEPLPVVAVELAEAHQIRVLHVGERAELVLEPVERVGAEVLQRLERDYRAGLAIVGLVHDAHSAVPQPAAQLESRRLQLALQHTCGSLPDARTIRKTPSSMPRQNGPR